MAPGLGGPMKAQTVDVRTSTGRILCCTVFRPGGKKLLSKGHVISEDDDLWRGVFYHQGGILCCTVFRPGGKKLLSKGHVISEDDVRVLQSEVMNDIWVTELEEGEV